MSTSTQPGLPLYLQVSEAIESRINEGEFQAGDRLPGDLALSEEYGISVITARAAMRVLIDKLRVVRYPGKGTFVRKDDVGRPIWGLGSMLDLVVTGLQTKLVLLERRLCMPPQWAADKFGVSRRSRLYLVCTARESEGQRFTISEVYYRERVGALMKAVDFADPALEHKLMIGVFQEQTGIKPYSTYQTITAEISNEDEAEKLGIPAGQPLLVLNRDYYDASGETVQVGRSKYRVDGYQYRTLFSNLEPPPQPHQRTLRRPKRRP